MKSHTSSHSNILELVEALVEERDSSMIVHTLLRIFKLSTQVIPEVRKIARNKCVVDFNNLIFNEKLLNILDYLVYEWFFDEKSNSFRKSFF